MEEVRRESEKQMHFLARQLYPLRLKKELGRGEFEKQLRRLLEEKAADIFLDPLLGLQTVLETVLTIVELAEAVERRKFRVRAGRIVLAYPPGLQRVAKTRGDSYRDLFRPLVETSNMEQGAAEDETTGPGALKGTDVKKLLLQYAFLRLFTGIEVFLQDTLVRALRDRDVWTHFSEGIRDEDVPTRWDDGRRITKFDYARRWQDVMTLLLRFPYHDFEGKVSHRYRAAFGFDLKRFPDLDRLVHYREFRNTLVHKGSARLGVPLVEVSEQNVIELARVTLRLAEYVETRVPQPKASARSRD